MAPLRIADRRGTVLDTDLLAVARDQRGVVGEIHDLSRDAETLSIGFSTGARVSSLMMRKTSSSAFPRASAIFQPVMISATGFRKVTRACNVGGDDRVADAGERRPRTSRAAAAALRCGARALPRPRPARVRRAGAREDRFDVLERRGANARFSSSSAPTSSLTGCWFKTCSASAVPCDARADLGKGDFARRRHVIAERREPAVVGGAELRERDVARRFEYAIAHFLRRFDARIDGRDHADKHALRPGAGAREWFRAPPRGLSRPPARRRNCVRLS